MIALTAAAMGFRNATVRQLKVADLTTTVLTLTVTGLAADSPAASGGDNPNLGRRIGAILAILIGALAGALLVFRIPVAATENRPLELHVSAGGQTQKFELDI